MLYVSKKKNTGPGEQVYFRASKKLCSEFADAVATFRDCKPEELKGQLNDEHRAAMIMFARATDGEKTTWLEVAKLYDDPILAKDVKAVVAPVATESPEGGKVDLPPPADLIAGMKEQLPGTEKTLKPKSQSRKANGEPA